MLAAVHYPYSIIFHVLLILFVLEFGVKTIWLICNLLALFHVAIAIMSV